MFSVFIRQSSIWQEIKTSYSLNELCEYISESISYSGLLRDPTARVEIREAGETISTIFDSSWEF